MRLVVADTGPINYLVLIDAIEVLPKLFEQVLVPAAVYDELSHADAPPPVRAFILRCRLGLRYGPIPIAAAKMQTIQPWTRANGPQLHLLRLSVRI
jgi:hypothetical protein